MRQESIRNGFKLKVNTSCTVPPADFWLLIGPEGDDF